MEKICRPSGESTSTNTATGRDHNCLNLSKNSHKISKVSFLRKTGSNAPLNQNHQSYDQTQNQLQSASPPIAAQQHQPPVYNINKNDFRDVVQKLTGPLPHERLSNPPPAHPPKPQNSRLQRIRPPPLAHVSHRPPQGQLPVDPNSFNPSTALNFGLAGRPMAPLSPLPPLPAVHAAAESPVSAYMRYFRNSISAVDSYPLPPTGFTPFGPLVSSCWDDFIPPKQQGVVPPPPSSAVLPSHPQFHLPSSPLAFGCLNSPRSAHPLFSPSLLFSPSAGQLGFPQFPASPTVPVPSPRWSGD